MTDRRPGVNRISKVDSLGLRQEEKGTTEDKMVGWHN